MNGFNHQDVPGRSSERQDHDSSRSRLRRPPTVGEAIQYSPFTSIVPFEAAVVPMPGAVSTMKDASTLSTNERSKARQAIHLLDSEAANPRSTSYLLGQTLADVQTLLNEVNLPEYQFMAPTLPQVHPQNYATEYNEVKLPPSQLGAFAQMVLDTTRVGYRYPTPVSPGQMPAENGHRTTFQNLHHASKVETPNSSSAAYTSQPQNLLQSPIMPKQHMGTNHTYPLGPHNQNMAIQQTPLQLFQQGVFDSKTSIPARQRAVVVVPSPHMIHAPRAANSQSSADSTDNATPYTSHDRQRQLLSPRMAVVVPSLPTSSDSRQYKTYPEIDATILQDQSTISKKRKRESPDVSVAIDRREIMDASVSNLQALLQSVFEAEDQLEPDTSGNFIGSAQNYFLSSSATESRHPILNSPALISLEDAINKVHKGGRVQDISVEHLSRLQRLCLSSIELASQLDMSIPQIATEDAARDFCRRIEAADNSLRASRLLLTVMIVGHEEMQLCSENMVQELLTNLRNSLEACIVPLVEKRSTTVETDILSVNSDSKSLVVGLMQRAGRVLKLLGDLVVKTDLSETAMTAIEFLSTKLVFVENATADKDSFLGVQKVELLRRHAMDVTSKVFLRCKDQNQRKYIFDEILSSLEKLPVTRQSARQYKIANGRPIQLVSALIMQLVQISSAMSMVEETNMNDDGSESAKLEDSDSSSASQMQIKKRKKKQSKTQGVKASVEPLTFLANISKPLINNAQSSAFYVVRYLIQRALKASKSGDQPYRNLLDIFTEDFSNVFGLPAWPAAEALLHALLSSLFGIMKEEKSNVPAKNMALDLLGSIGSTIADMRRYVNRCAETIDEEDYQLSNMSQFLEDSLEGNANERTIVGLHGPYRFLLEHIQGQKASDSHMQSASQYYLASWAQKICSASSLIDSKDIEDESFVQKTATWLAASLQNPELVPVEKTTDVVSDSAARLYYALLLLNLPMCKAFDGILNLFLKFLGSSQVLLRNRSLKSVVHLLEKDPSILDRSSSVMAMIMRCSSDQSALVRESALGLMGKCITLKPSLEAKVSISFIARSADASTGVRKRALKLLREVYLRSTTTTQLRIEFVDAILLRFTDVEDSVAELARQIMEDVWLTPFYDTSNTERSAAELRIELEQQASLIVATAERGDEVLDMLAQLFKGGLQESSKNVAFNHKVCRALVEVLFDWIIDNDQSEGRPAQKNSLLTLSIFAKAEPRLFSAEQMLTLRPYIENLTSREDLLVFRSVVTIYRRVLPALPALQRTFLIEIQAVLFKNIQKLGKTELSEATMCLWIIDGVLQNTEKLARLLASVLRGIQSANGKDLSTSQEGQRLPKYLNLAGYLGKACNVEIQKKDVFLPAFPGQKFESVYELIVNTVLPFTARGTPLRVREDALEALCLVCQAWPRGYQKGGANKAFKAAFEDPEPCLKGVILSGVRSFYFEEEERAKTEPEWPVNSAATGGDRLGKSMVSSDNDGASTTIAHQFLPYILKVALGDAEDLALIATEVIASINRQGLVHPKEIGSALVALEASPVLAIAKIAMEEHRDMHSKHESMLDKEYQKSLEQSFFYLRDALGDVSGLNADKTPKLGRFYEVLKTGSITSRKKLFNGICTRIESDLKKLTADGKIEQQLEYVRFLLNNLATFDYGRIDELVNLISGLDKVFTTCGNVVAQQIEPLINTLPLGALDSGVMSEFEEKLPTSNVLSVLTATSVVLCMLWETRSHLKRAWGLQSLRAGTKAKATSKDISKAPTRVASVTSEDFLGKLDALMQSLKHQQSMVDQCKAFLNLMAVDHDGKETSEEEMITDERAVTPSDIGTEDGGLRNSMQPPPGGGRKKQGSISATSTPQKTGKKKGRPSLGGQRRSSKSLKGFGEDAETEWA